MTLAAVTETHRLRQVALRNLTIRRLQRIYPLLDFDDIAGSWPAVEAALVPLVRDAATVSAAIAGDYYQTFRAEAGASGSPTLRLAPPPSEAEIVPSLRIAGPKTAGRLVYLRPLDAPSVTFTNLSGDVTRQVLNGGRNTVLGSVDADPQAYGYARATSGKACAFCAMLASRGPVYKTEASGGFDAHNHCACSVQPLYDRSQSWPPGGRDYQTLWNQSTKGLSGADARKAFRRAIEGR